MNEERRNAVRAYIDLVQHREAIWRQICLLPGLAPDGLIDELERTKDAILFFDGEPSQREINAVMGPQMPTPPAVFAQVWPR